MMLIENGCNIVEYVQEANVRQNQEKLLADGTGDGGLIFTEGHFDPSQAWVVSC